MNQSYSEKIDIFTHFVPDKYRKALYSKTHSSLYEGWFSHRGAIPGLFDVSVRLGIIDKYQGLKQVLSISGPPLEMIATPNDAAELAKLANEEMAELVAKYPNRFIACVACLPMNDIDAALSETERAIEMLNMKGVEIFTPCDGKPLDSPEFMPLYEMLTKYDLPIWLHPIRGRETPDYKGESHSKYGIFSAIGWPYETTIAMARLVLSGVLEKYPSLKVITHHCGGMVPYFAGRQTYRELNVSLSRPPVEYMRMFYGDTALMGNVSALMCGYAFFGAKHIVFGSDMPENTTVDKEQKIAHVIDSVEHMDIPETDKYQIFEGNARALLHL